MPASAADPVSSVLKNAFASNVAGRNGIGAMHQTAAGLIRGGSSSSVISSNGSLDHEPTSFKLNGPTKMQNINLASDNSSLTSSSPNLENGIRANAKKVLLSSQQCNVEFDAPTRYVGGIGFGQSLNNSSGSSNVKSRVIVLNPHQKQLQVTQNTPICK